MDHEPQAEFEPLGYFAGAVFLIVAAVLWLLVAIVFTIGTLFIGKEKG